MRACYPTAPQNRPTTDHGQTLEARRGKEGLRGHFMLIAQAYHPTAPQSRPTADHGQTLGARYNKEGHRA